MMKKIILLILATTINVFSWEINTHRAIERKAIEKSENLQTFVKNSGIQNIDYSGEKFEGYHKDYRGDYTYTDYVTNGELNGVSDKRWKQIFPNGKPSYQKLIEAGSILEDAQWPHASSLFDWQDRADGRFVNHFYDAQNGGLGLIYLRQRYQNALLWGGYGTKKDVPVSIVSSSNKENDYSYKLALGYFLKGFTDPNPDERRRYQAKMLISLGQYMHLMNDMTSPAHTRGDSHAEGDVMEVYGRGGEKGETLTGFRIVKNTVKDYLGLPSYNGSINLPNIPKYSKFSGFITKESYWTATHFFSKDTVYTKAKPSVSDTYESYDSSLEGIDKYYIRSYGNGTVGCSNGCVPSGTKLAIRIKSYIIRGLKRYYTGSSSNNIVLDKTTTFKGDYSVLKNDAKLLIPRAIANARNFLDYFFRIQLSVTVYCGGITVKNISKTSLVKDTSSITLKKSSILRFKYIKPNGTMEAATIDVDPDRPIDATYDPTVGIFYLTKDIKPGESFTIPVKNAISLSSI